MGRPGVIVVGRRRDATHFVRGRQEAELTTKFIGVRFWKCPESEEIYGGTQVYELRT